MPGSVCLCIVPVPIMEWMFLDCDLAPWSNHAPQCAFQVVKSTCELPTGCARARHGAAEGGTGQDWNIFGMGPRRNKMIWSYLPCIFTLISHSTLKRSPRDVSLLQYYKVRKIRILYLILAILQQFTSAFIYIVPHTKFQKSSPVFFCWAQLKKTQGSPNESACSYFGQLLLLKFQQHTQQLWNACAALHSTPGLFWNNLHV